MSENSQTIIQIKQVSNWVKESQQGSVVAFENLYREFHQRLYLFCLRMSGVTGVAEELVQESFIKAWRALPEFRHDAGFYTWLRKIASRLAIDRLRLKNEKVWQNMTELDETEYLLTARSENSNSLDNIRDLEKLIALLPEGARNVLVMHDIEGYGHKEISALLGIAEGTSKAQVARARKLLRQAYFTSSD